MRKLFLVLFSVLNCLMIQISLVRGQQGTTLNEVGIVAPPVLNIDGKNFEWKPTDFSDNKQTGLSYLITNDTDNLYLIVRCEDVMNTSKIFAGGITFLVNTEGEKREKDGMSLTYPLPVRNRMRGGMGAAMRGANSKDRDSMILSMQRSQLKQAKEIKLTNLKVTTDTLISIYNLTGIKAYANFDKQEAYFCEVAIPLAELGLSKTGPKEIAFNIRLNGLQFGGFDGRGPGNRGGGFRQDGRNGFSGGAPRGGGFDFQAFTSPTDFWGKYMIRK